MTGVRISTLQVQAPGIILQVEGRGEHVRVRLGRQTAQSMCLRTNDTRRKMELTIERTEGGRYQQRYDDDVNKVSDIKPERYRDSPMHSGGLSGSDVESGVQRLMGSLECVSSAVLRRFGMDDVVDIDEDDMAALEASPEWRDLLPHVRRSVLSKRKVPAVGRVHFVPRMIRGRPGTVYAVR